MLHLFLDSNSFPKRSALLYLVSHDELQLYSKPIEEIIKECEENNWEFVTGGFLDRIGENGEFPKITKESNVWTEMPNAGFFR